MMRQKQEPILDDVLNEFVAESENPTAEALERWARRYPQFRRELVDFAAAWTEQIFLSPAPELSEEEEKRLVDRAMSHVQNVTFLQNEEAEAGEASGRPIRSLTDEARRAGMNAQEFAKACGLNLSLITKLNNRRIRPLSIPVRFVEFIARLLSLSADVVRGYLALPPQTLADRAFLSRGKPQATEQQSFADAVRESSLSDAEKARWLDESERLDES